MMMWVSAMTQLKDVLTTKLRICACSTRWGSTPWSPRASAIAPGLAAVQKGAWDGYENVYSDVKTHCDEF